VINPGMSRELNQRAMEQALRALALVLQAGNFGLVVLDLAEAPIEIVSGLPCTTWLRLQRMVEGSQTVAMLVGRTPIARSSGGLTIKLETRDSGLGAGSRRTLFTGFDVEARVVRARTRGQDDARALFATQGHVNVGRQQASGIRLQASGIGLRASSVEPRAPSSQPLLCLRLS